MNRPSRTFKLLAASQALWLATVCILVGWWSTLLRSQAEQIASLKRSLGATPESSIEELARTHRMLFWESGTFLVLLVLISSLIFWLYWRDYRRNRGIQAFFASVTHELRTPLTSIRLQAESIADLTENPSAQKPLIGRLLEDTERLESQVERTLELARLEGGGPVFNQSLSLKSWMDRFIKHGLPSRTEQIKLHASLEDHWILGDESALQVVLKNLIENSMKHSGQESLEITIQSKKESPWILLKYRDNGKGFSDDPETLGRLFQKGEKSTGAGVGLYLVRTLTEKMGGSAKFSGREGFRAELRFRESNLHG